MSGIEYREHEGTITPELLTELGTVFQGVFHGPGEPALPVERAAEFLGVGVNGHRWIYLCMAYMDGEQVGYKLGRSNDPRTFESWNGGVLPHARKRGIAAELARRQETWCRDQGFGFLMTVTAHDNRPMLIVNLKQGFHIAGTYLDRETNMKVVLQKSIS
ncbi:MAG: GNAT family N-acetyltransferase [Myxococcota bacterium]|nr:GNAT family N-acetyltransferase [Myxococcota bacterium]